MSSKKMKKRFLIFCLSIITFSLQAQVPQGLNYQAVARDARGCA